MPDKATILREKTYKDLDEIDSRVFYTLAGKDNKVALQAHRNSKAIALLIKHLTQRGLISEEELDELLFECAVY